MRYLFKWYAALGLAAMLLTFSTGCAQDVGDIDRTQPNKIDKSTFQNNDKWYFRQSVVDTSIQNAGPIFKGRSSGFGLKRIRWEITENTLYAYSTVPQAEDLYEGEVSEEDRKFQAVAAFPIISHFDVQRSYNPSTGEPTNVIVENRSDRPWYEREYMRVDWSKNLVDGLFLFGSRLGRFSATQYNPPQEDDHVNPDRTRISDDYIDVTVQYSYFPSAYACQSFLGREALYHCNGGKVRVRNSFKKIDETEAQDFIPLNHTDNKKLTETGKDEDPMLMTTRVFDPASRNIMKTTCDDKAKTFLKEQYGATSETCSPETFSYNGRFGYFQTMRSKFNEERVNKDASRRHYANRWPIWKDYHARKDNVSEYPDYKEALNKKEGEDAKVVLDPADRKPQPIVYHLNAKYPQDMVPAAREVERQWDQSMKEAVALAKYSHEGQKVGMTKEEIKDEYVPKVEKQLKEMYGHDKMFVIKKNSCHPSKLAEWKSNYGQTKSADRRNIERLFADAVQGDYSGDELTKQLSNIPNEDRIQLCADLEYATEKRNKEEAQFSWERLGDLRYSFFTWFREDVPWLGYGPSAADPLTGRIISAAANANGSYYRDMIPYYADIIKFINGELSAEEIEYGEHVRQALEKAQKKGALTREQSLEAKSDVSEPVQKELAERMGASPNKLEQRDYDGQPKVENMPKGIKLNGVEGLKDYLNRTSASNARANKVDQRYQEFYQKPEVKNFLMKEPKFQQLVRAAAAEKYGAPKNGKSFDQKQLHQAYLDMTSPQQLHQREQRSLKYKAERTMFAKKNLRRAVEGLITLDGVAKAFKGIDRDKLERYLLDNAFVGTMLHEVGHTVGLRHNFSASMDAINYHDNFWKIQAKVEAGEMSPSEATKITGDYAEKLSDELDAKRISIPDKAEQYVSQEEFRQASVMDYTADLTGRFAGLGKYDQAAINFAYARHIEQWKDEVELPNLKSIRSLTEHYSNLPAVIAGNMSALRENASEEEEAQAVIDGINTILDGREWVPVQQAIRDQREGIKSNAKNWKEGEFSGGSDSKQPYISRTVSYNYCSDEFANLYMDCSVFDHGSNQTEVVDHAFDQYRVFQPFWRYKGQDNTRRLLSSYYGRMFRTLRVINRPFRYFAYLRWADYGDYTEDLRRAAMKGFNFYGEVMSIPEPGRYCKAETSSVDVNEGYYYSFDNTFVPADWTDRRGNCDDYIDIEQGVGYPYNYDFTDEYLYRLQRVGTFVDKLAATVNMFNVNANFARSAYVTDSRATYLSYWSVFKPQMLDFLKGVLLEDYSGYAGVFNPKKQRYEPRQLISAETFGQPKQNPNGDNPRVLSRVSFTHQFQTLAGGMIVNNAWQDRAVDFNQYVKVAVTNEELQPFPEEETVVKFVHPESQQIYHAPKAEDDQSIAVDLIEWAKRIKPKLKQAKKDLAEVEQELEGVEEGTDEYERLKSRYNGRWEEKNRYEENLQDIVSKLDMVRFVDESLGASSLR